MLNSLRPYLTKFLEPLASRLNINPNIVTVISPFIAILSAIFFASGNLIGGAFFITYALVRCRMNIKKSPT